jgi:hypothetical protein
MCRGFFSMVSIGLRDCFSRGPAAFGGARNQHWTHPGCSHSQPGRLMVEPAINDQEVRPKPLGLCLFRVTVDCHAPSLGLPCTILRPASNRRSSFGPISPLGSQKFEMAYQYELLDAACYHVDEQVKQIMAFDVQPPHGDSSRLPSRQLVLYQLRTQLTQSLGKLLGYMCAEGCISIEAEQVHIALTPGDAHKILVLFQVVISDLGASRLKCILPSEKADDQSVVQYFEKSVDMVHWIREHMPTPVLVTPTNSSCSPEAQHI